MEAPKAEAPWKHLRHVTVGDAFAEAKASMLAWFVLSLVTLFIGGMFEGLGLLAGIGESDFYSALPKWVWWAVTYGGLLWYMRGKEVKFVFPQLNFKLWLFLTALVSIWLFALDQLKWWISIPLFWAMVFTFSALDALNQQGRKNYEALRVSQEE